MNKLNHAVRALLALGLLVSSGAVFAQSAVYSPGSTVTVSGQDATPVALGPNGQVLVSTLVTNVPGQGSYPQSGSAVFSGAIPEYVVTNNYITGANGVGLSTFGPTITFGSYGNTGNANGYAYDAYTGSFTPVAIGANGIASNINNLYSDLDEGYAGQGVTGAVVNTNTGVVTYTGNGTQVAAINASNAVTGTLYASVATSGTLGGYNSRSSTTVGYSQYDAAAGPAVPAGAVQVPFYESASAASEIGGKLAVSEASGVNSPVLTPTIISTLGYGGNGVAINVRGQVAGNDFLSSQTCQYGFGSNCEGGFYSTPNTEAFVTAPNGGPVTYLGETIGTTVGISSTATAVDNAGAVGGYIMLANGQTQAFISDPGTGNNLVAVDTPDDSSGYDSTETLFLNNDGQAIIWNASTNTFWLDNAGTDYLVSSLFSPSAFAPGDYIDGVSGFNDSGEILLDVVNSLGQDPAVLGEQVGTFDPTAGTNVELTTQYVNYESEGGAAPTTPYFAPPSAPPAPDSSVPEPSSFGLLGLGMLAIGAGLFGRKRKELIAA